LRPRLPLPNAAVAGMAVEAVAASTGAEVAADSMAVARARARLTAEVAAIAAAHPVLLVVARRT